MRAAASRARVPPSGVPLTFTSSSSTPVALSASPFGVEPRNGTVRLSGTWAPGANVSATGVNSGATASVATSPFRASRIWPSVPSGLPRCRRTSRSPTGSGPALVSVPVTVSVVGPSAVTTRG